MVQKSELNAEYRAQLVLRWLSVDKPAAQIARQAGISPETLYRWIEEFVDGGKRALNGRDTEDMQARALAQLPKGHITAVRACGETMQFNLLEEAEKWLDEGKLLA